jgi:hypothetical protein
MWSLFLINHLIIKTPAWLLFENPDLNLGPEIYRFSGILAFIFLCLSLIRPVKLLWFTLALIFWSYVKSYTIPWVPNHIFMALILNISLLAGIISVRKFEQGKEKMMQLFQRVAPVLRLVLLILYFFTVFHKLNVDYFNPEVSCAVTLYKEIAAFLPFLPNNNITAWLTIAGTLIIETLIPVLLMIPRTRVLAISLGIVFHFVLALHPNLMIASFTFEVIAMYSLFLPDSISTRLFLGLKGCIDKFLACPSHCKILIPATAFAVFVGLTIFIIYLLPGTITLKLLMLKSPIVIYKVYIFAWIFILIILSFVLAIVYKFDKEPLTGILRPAHRAFIIFPALLILNGLTPYFGIKTATNFSMFSNLRIAGTENNHLIVRKNLPLTPYSGDLVEIIDTDQNYLKAAKIQQLDMTFFELQRWVQYYGVRSTGFLRFKRGQEIKTVRFPESADLPEFNQIGWIEKRLMVFRFIPRNNPCPCQW